MELNSFRQPLKMHQNVAFQLNEIKIDPHIHRERCRVSSPRSKILITRTLLSSQIALTGTCNCSKTSLDHTLKRSP